MFQAKAGKYNESLEKGETYGAYSSLGLILNGV